MHLHTSTHTHTYHTRTTHTRLCICTHIQAHTHTYTHTHTRTPQTLACAYAPTYRHTNTHPTLHTYFLLHTHTRTHRPSNSMHKAKMAAAGRVLMQMQPQLLLERLAHHREFAMTAQMPHPLDDPLLGTTAQMLHHPGTARCCTTQVRPDAAPPR